MNTKKKKEEWLAKKMKELQKSTVSSQKLIYFYTNTISKNYWRIKQNFLRNTKTR
jgi:hypothetical protein